VPVLSSEACQQTNLIVKLDQNRPFQSGWL